MPGDGPDNMAMYAWHQQPAIDMLFNQFAEGVNAQFGNVRSVRELASVARSCEGGQRRQRRGRQRERENPLGKVAQPHGPPEVTLRADAEPRKKAT